MIENNSMVLPMISMALAVASVVMTSAPTQGKPSTCAPPEALPFVNVKLNDAFWSPRLEVIRRNTIPDGIRFCESTGRISNFAKAGGLMSGSFEGLYYNDSDLYKVIEGAAYSLAEKRDPELEKICDDVIDKIASAQQPDGYLFTNYTVKHELDKRWTEPQMHEDYCAGHLMEAAIAYYEATGKRKLLDVAIRLANHLVATFGPEKKHLVPGHEEVELALVKLYRLTGDDHYLRLADFYIEERGHANGRKLMGEYCQDHKPIRKQTMVVGHAVRAMYYFLGVADIAAISGDKTLVSAMDRLWDELVAHRMYITGGIGTTSENEGFTHSYDLPNDTAYCETCASIGLVLWSHRLSLLHKDAKYADIMERALYNGVMSGISLSGDRFNYTNPLASDGTHHRRDWSMFETACCPTSMVRFPPSIGGYIYAYLPDEVYVNLYVAGKASIPLKNGPVTVEQKTNYPWDGHITLTVETETPRSFGLNLRIPGWASGKPVPSDLYAFADSAGPETVLLKVNGKLIAEPKVKSGYALIQRRWRNGDKVELDLPMPVRRVEANPAVKANVGRIALQRGPIVYCIEGMDVNGKACDVSIHRDSALATHWQPDLLGGVAVISGTGYSVQKDSQPTQPISFTAVPYCTWDNRESGDMAVWIPETTTVSSGESAAGR